MEIVTFILVGVLCLFVGFVAGMLLYFRIVHKSGTLIANVEDPDRDIYRLELTDDLETLPDKKYIILRVKKL